MTTVDKYQGQQNDYILLSLVKTKAVGHLRDVRRLVVAMSRARLGLYIFARVSLFKNCFELTPAFNQLMTRPMTLRIAPHETYPTNRDNCAPPAASVEMSDMPQMAAFVYDFYIQKVEAMKSAYYVSKNLVLFVAFVKSGTYSSNVFQSSETDWKKPGTVKESLPQHYVTPHPGGEDTDSEDEEERSKLAQEEQKPPEKPLTKEELRLMEEAKLIEEEMPPFEEEQEPVEC